MSNPIDLAALRQQLGEVRAQLQAIADTLAEAERQREKLRLRREASLAELAAAEAEQRAAIADREHARSCSCGDRIACEAENECDYAAQILGPLEGAADRRAPGGEGE